MDPLVDEKIILTASAAFMELAYDWLGISIKREAYGPTENEGLCFEYCAGIPFSGDLDGELYVAMDGYTKILLLPYIARRFSEETFHPEVAENALLSFSNQLGGMVITELQEFMQTMQTQPPRVLSHQLHAIPSDKYRKYMLIYFLRDEEKHAYLGRMHLMLAVKKEVKNP